MHIAIQLGENKTAPKKIQLLRVGEWKSYKGGKGFKITKEHIDSLVKNFNDGARRYQDKKLPIDYFHNSDEKAGGWICNLQTSEDGNELWADVEWTKTATQMLEDGEVRYVSCDLHQSYIDEETGKKFGHTLFGAALTNRPFVKNMQALTAAEEEKQNLNGGKKVNELETAQAEVKKLEGIVEQHKNDVVALRKELSDMKTQNEANEKKLAEDKKLADKKSKFDLMLSEGKVVEGQREAFMSDDMMKFSENAKPLNLGGGKSKEGEDKESDTPNTATPAQDEIIEKSKKLSEEKKISYAAAQRLVLSENPKLRERYEKETTIN